MKKTLAVINILLYILSYINTNAQVATAAGGTTTSTGQQPTIEFVGDANVQKSLTNGEALPVNTGIGVIYKEILDSARYKWLYSIDIGLSVNVASTVDTLKTIYNAQNQITNKSDFGNSVLLPLNSGQAFNFSFKGYFTQYLKNNSGNKCRVLSDKGGPIPFYGLISGFYANFTGSNRNWNDTLNKTTVKASNISTQIGIFHEFIKSDTSIRKNYSITLGVGYTGRFLLGDISQDPYKDLRSKIVGSNRTSYQGLEVILGMRLKNIKAEIRIPFLSKKNNFPGLSGVQPNTFIGFSGGFPLDLR